MHRRIPLEDALTPRIGPADADLSRRILLLCQGIINAHDEENGFLPFFYIDVRGGRLSYQHSSWALDDSTFRNISALARAFRLTHEPKLLPFLQRMVPNLEHSLEIGRGINAAGDRALMHNMSRGLAALSALAELEAHRGESARRQMWVDRIGRFLDRLLQVYQLEGWETGQAYDLSCGAWRTHEPAPAASGRTIGALVRSFLITRDDRAMQLAQRLIEANLECFGEDGSLCPSAGEHFHSIADTVQGMLLYAATARDAALLERCQRIYWNGLKAHGIDATGWFAEHVHWPGSAPHRRDGEICCTANMISCALLLGRAGYTEAFEDAERYIRNMLFASQLLDLSSVMIEDEPRWPEFSRRLIGNVAGFPSSTGAYDATSPHLTQLCCPAQAVEALCDAWESCVTIQGSASSPRVALNLLFSIEHELMEVVSGLPIGGSLAIRIKRDLNLCIKSPPGAGAPEIHRDRPAAIGPALRGEYLDAGFCPAGSSLHMRFDLPRRQSLEGCALQPMTRFHWLGNSVVDCDSHPELLPLYAGRAAMAR